MLSSLIEHLRRHSVGYLALFVALGGTSYAAVNLPRGSVGARQIRNHSIDPVKLNPRFITGNVRAWAVVASDGRIIRGGGKPRGASTPTPGVYEITWGTNLKHSCSTVATVDFAHSPATEEVTIPGNSTVNVTAGYAVAELAAMGTGRSNNITYVHTFDQLGHLTPLGFDVAIIC